VTKMTKYDILPTISFASPEQFLKCRYDLLSFRRRFTHRHAGIIRTPGK
jgi:hypothetical protein